MTLSNIKNMKGLSHKYDEEISEHSYRFAPLGFYTSRTGIFSFIMFFCLFYTRYS